jgi:hypothetical protein
MGTKVRADLTLTREAYEQFKKLVPSVSAEVDIFIRKRVAELQGGQTTEDRDANYNAVKSKYEDLMIKTVRLERKLKASKYFQEATDLLLELGLKKDLSNADELVPLFMKAWKGDESFMHEFLNLVELARDKKRALQALTVMRSEPAD